MSDRLLKQLRGVAIEQDVAADSRWDALAAGVVSPEEEAKLRAWAEQSPEARAAFEVFQPSDEATLDALAEDALARLKERDWDSPERSPSGAGIEKNSRQGVRAKATASSVYPLRPERSRAPVVSGLVIGVVMLAVLGSGVSYFRKQSSPLLAKAAFATMLQLRLEDRVLWEPVNIGSSSVTPPKRAPLERPGQEEFRPSQIPGGRERSQDTANSELGF